MKNLIIFLTTSFIVRVFIWVPLRFWFLRIFGLYVGSHLFNFVGGLLVLYFLERFFVLFQVDDGRGLVGVFIPEWVEKPVTLFIFKVTRPFRKQWFIFKNRYPPQ
ncbi:hypothetical protein IQ258_05915 [Coleofasciculus sp. LEGE 07081]|uniref:hypothetical protein n=1 Tax=Coleofasciculus sp. LEGE 07081 TaxID=2777967 RepID=UPI001881EDAD|nr:hypothetical protein [Coleofasciculus sp. LEGE 07081]MBE9125703.1 hypothetical protein [Coleofasciculus sp. LEGE 07081]